MSDLTTSTLFSGGGGADIGAMLAGFKPVCSNEYDQAIAAVYEENLGNHMRVGDILEQNPHDWPDTTHLHASPPCPNFSAAKTWAVETPHDIALATKVAEFIVVKKPRWFTLENVPAYRKSASFAIICKALSENGYIYDAPILNSADFGVPQTRKRLFLRATRDGLLRQLPEPTRWIGWYEAIVDLLDTLPESEFAEWQLKRLPADIFETCVFSHNELTGTTRGEMTPRKATEPYPTVIAGDFHRPSSVARAFLLNGANAGRELTIVEQHEPVFTQSATNKAAIRAWLSQGCVVKMTPRALARFQSFPDWYKLPEKAALACRIIGNAVPPLMAAAVLKSLRGEV